MFFTKLMFTASLYCKQINIQKYKKKIQGFQKTWNPEKTLNLRIFKKNPGILNKYHYKTLIFK